MDSITVRKNFLDFFKSKNHLIVPSAPMVIKNDPTLMFTNAGMNQFKDIFLGNSAPKNSRIADSQKCLRVSGKHNDLEEVGVDTYHHTMFEMLGNWSFGDYFKKEAIKWGWELLTEVYKIDKSRLYVTVFGGDKSDKLDKDDEAYNFWKELISEDRILFGSKKDNFWEMGETGPCGPCSEIHADIRDDDERKKIDGKTLVNTGHPQVIEIWNLVFIQFNRHTDGSLNPLPAKHVDTGMGFERLCMVLQNKKSNYDTDVFQPIICGISDLSGKKYGDDIKTDIALRVIADHLRAISFAIADGQLPSNNKAGYVIRRILRRAVRYGFTYLNLKNPFIFKLVPILVNQMGDYFPELISQKELIQKVILEEENAFIRTIESGLKRIDQIIDECKTERIVSGKKVFELYDTYGFPVDLTQLILKENNLELDEKGFEDEMKVQKERSRKAAAVDTDDWVILKNIDETEFVGYDLISTDVEILKYRKVKQKDKTYFQLMFDRTPFYAESGGQVGDKGFIESDGERIDVTDTRKENNLIVHIVEKLPSDPSKSFTATVDVDKRFLTANNHSATHLLQAALRRIVGQHIEQKGSYVNDEYLRFDFSHFVKLTKDEIANVEELVNNKIRENIKLDEKRNIPYLEAINSGATALFGEKYGEFVRMITFDPEYSIELCGGTHVKYTGNIGLFKIISESAIAAGVRRITAITGPEALKFYNDNLNKVERIKETLKNPKDVVSAVSQLVENNNELQKKLEKMVEEKANILKQQLISKVRVVNGINMIAEIIDLDSADAVKNLIFQMHNEFTDNAVIVLGGVVYTKPSLSVMISQEIIKSKNLNAGNISR
ncbi:MAG: alanine--tRNA ligase, partial [Bacteroidota bacterium]|nr:alanine--tRNA ligase [Bacteroidota bacterium]